MPKTAPHRRPAWAISIAVASATPRTDVADSQDRAGVLRTPAGGAAIVCDGVGSLPESGIVAQHCLESVTEQLGRQSLERGLEACAPEVSSTLEESCAGVDGATTLLVIAADAHGSAYFTAVGNGSIFQLEELMSPPDRVELGFTELVIPHVSPARGRAALRSYLPAAEACSIEYSFGSLLSTSRKPRLLLCCSDGVSTLEDRRLGRTSSGLWQPLAAPFTHVLNALAERWETILAEPGADQELETALSHGLHRALDRGDLSDDASVGAVLLHPVPLIEEES